MKKVSLVVATILIVVFASAQKTPPKTKLSAVGGNGILLSYVGALTGSFSMSMGIHFEMDSSIGFRYDYVTERGSTVISHIAIFYKFSDPTSMTHYNYQTHKITVLTNGQSPSSSDANVEVVGTPTLAGYACTLLEHKNDHEVDNYWMSPSVPGFKELLGVFNKINPEWVSIGLTGTVFNWGGLVKLSSDFSAGNQQGHFELNLNEATKGLLFPASEFDPPKK